MTDNDPFNIKVWHDDKDPTVIHVSASLPIRRSLPYHGIARMTKEQLDEFSRRHNPKEGICTCGCNVPDCWIECKVHPKEIE